VDKCIVHRVESTRKRKTKTGRSEERSLVSSLVLSCLCVEMTMTRVSEWNGLTQNINLNFNLNLNLIHPID